MSAIGLASLAAAAGLFWTPPGEMPAHPDLYSKGLYRRDTPFTAGGAQGSDLLGLCVIGPVAVWAMAGRLSLLRRLILIGFHAWWLYLGASLAFGAVAFNEAFPLYVAMIPVSTAGLVMALRGLGDVATPRFLPSFLIGCGVVTSLVWSLLLWIEMTSGAYPPATYYTARATYAIDLGVIAPGCAAAGAALWRSARWGMTQPDRAVAHYCPDSAGGDAGKRRSVTSAMKNGK
jgi:hypothetical protein